MALVIIESPNKRAKLSKILGSDYEIMPTIGHIMDLPPKELGVDLDTFKPTYKVYPEKKKVVTAIKDAAKNHDVIYIATDADREGEAIGFHIVSQLPKRGVKIHRVRFNEISKKAVLKAFKNPSKLDKELFNAQQARRIVDRIVGFRVSPVMWGKGLSGTSAGRVQSVALKYVADREKSIMAFIPKEYWEIKVKTDIDMVVDFYGLNGKKFIPKTKKQTKEIVKDLIGKSLTVSDYQKKPRTRKPYPPFITSSLQQAANSQLGWGAKRTMDVAQELFSFGTITYHRSDSIRVNEDKIKELREKIIKKYGEGYLPKKAIEYGVKAGAQDAHEAIRPTGEVPPDDLSSDQKALFSLISRRFVASQMSDAKFETASAKLTYKGKADYEFRVNGSVLLFDGFLKVYGDLKDDELLPSLKVGQKLKCEKIIPTKHSTRPPSRFTEASLVDRLEKSGVGRPSTYASIIETLLKRSYVTKQKRTLIATDIGIMVSDYLSNFFPNLVSPDFTANIEAELDNVADGDKDWVKVLDKFYSSLKDQIETAKDGNVFDIFLTDIECEGCKDGKMVKRSGKNGVFLGCQNYPKCGYVLNHGDDGELKPSSVPTGKPCPKCNNILVERDGKYGKFLGCSNFSGGCKYVLNLDYNGDPVRKSNAENTGIKCKKCGKGEMIKREGKYGPWLSCNRYPKCKTTANLTSDGKMVVKKKAKKLSKKCPKCGTNLFERDGKFGKFASCGGYPKCKYIDK